MIRVSTISASLSSIAFLMEVNLSRFLPLLGVTLISRKPFLPPPNELRILNTLEFVYLSNRFALLSETLTKTDFTLGEFCRICKVFGLRIG